MEEDEQDLSNDQELDSDSSDAEEKALEQEVIDLENKLLENKFAYQPYLDLINVFKSLADYDRLRGARERMANQFPLSPDLWIDWLKDEVNMATSAEEVNKVVDLFERAVKDYLSVDIWIQYITFVINCEKDKILPESITVKKTFEAALTAAGLHVTRGSILWEAYVEYEKEVLCSLQDKKQEFESQLKVIGNLYKRQLSCPLWNMDKNYDSFQNWVSENEQNHPGPIIDKKMVENIYKKAKEKLEKIKIFEEQLLSETDNQMEVYDSYLEHEKSKEGSPVRVQCLYERILCDNCLNERIWLDYINYVDTVLNIENVVLNVCERALRNCPWCCQLYQAYIKCLEKYEKSQQLITEVVERAFASGLQTASDFRDIWMTYLEYLRRSFDSPTITKEEEEKRLESLKTAFASAVEFLYQLPDADPECTVAQFWARIEANYCKNMEKSRELWNNILLDEQNKTAEMWLEYIHLERTFGNSKHLKKLFPRALQHTKDYPEKIGKVWLNYERDEGTFQSYYNCINKIELRAKEMEEKREKENQILNSEIPGNNVRTKSKKNSLPKQKEKIQASTENEPSKISGHKRKQNFDEESSPTKKTKKNETKENNEQQSTHDIVDNLLKEAKASHGETVAHDSSKDDRTVFVSNLDYSTEESTIRDIFDSCGVIKDLRLVRDYKGRSKGYCYVEFENQKQAQAALKKDRELINRRPIFVSKCDPDKETRTSGFKYSSRMEKNKLFVRGLPFSTTVEELKELFSQYGALTDVRLVTYRNGHSKGLAYVDFENEAAAAQAILKTDGMTIQGKEISVAISNPPGRKTEPTSKLVPSLGGGPKELGPRGKGRTQISFLPRSVQLNKPPADALANLSIASPLPEEKNKKLDNSDFRQFLH